MSNKRWVWTKRVEAWRASGESVAGFCRARELTYAQFVYWQRVLRAAHPDAGTLVPVMIEASETPRAAIEVVLPNGVQVRCTAVSDAIALVRGWSC